MIMRIHNRKFIITASGTGDLARGRLAKQSETRAPKMRE